MHIDLNESDRDLPVDLPIEVRVKQGMMLLDEKYGPEWVHRIDLDTLELWNGCLCVIGQLHRQHEDDFAAYIRGRRDLDLHGHAPVSHGFAADRDAGPEAWDHLTTAWKAAIIARRDELSS